MSKKLIFSFIKSSFEKENYILMVTQCTSAKTKLKYICPKGHKHSITWDKWKCGRRCPTCYKLIRMPTIENIKVIFEQVGYILLSKEYINSKQKLDYICSNGHKHSISWSNFKQGRRCHKCSVTAKEGLENCNWKGGVNKLNLPLYETYAEQLITYNNIHVTNHNNLILLGVECTYCKNIFVPTSSEVHRRIRALHGKRPGDANFYCSENCKTSCTTYGQIKYPKGFNQKDNIRSGQTQWSLLVKKRDNYICQKCGLKEDIMYAHHINPVAFEPLESMDIDNGITLCKKCHKMIHQLPGCLINELRC